MKFGSNARILESCFDLDPISERNKLVGVIFKLACTPAPLPPPGFEIVGAPPL